MDLGSVRQDHLDSGEDFKLWKDIELTATVAEILQSKESFLKKRNSRVLVLL